MNISEIIEIRRHSHGYDEDLWSFMDQVHGRNLQNLSLSQLQTRLDAIDKNIQYLDGGSTPRADLPANRGWISPLWWMRARHWTLLEFSHRQASPTATPIVPAMPALAIGFDGVMSGGRRLLVRLSRKDRLLDMLKGHFRLARATLYLGSGLDAGLNDDEMMKAYKRPGQQITITHSDGHRMATIGDIAFSTSRKVSASGAPIEHPYWFCSFSSDLDPRLFLEWTSSDACIVIFNPDEFVKRLLPRLNLVAPHTLKELFPTDYYDPYLLDGHEIRTKASKSMEYAYQREMRFSLDPDGGPAISAGDFHVDGPSIDDIAAVYCQTGQKIAGTGPDSFLQ